MEETECIVCFSEYDGEEHRPRALACGHTLCTECLEKGIRDINKACPKCRKAYSASNINDIPINFTLEGVMKLLKITKTAKANLELQMPAATPDKVPECLDHQLPVSHRCTTHKSWVCQTCLHEDHPSSSCEIITLNEELNAKKATQIDKAKSLLKEFEERSKKSDDYNEQCEKLLKDNDEEIARYEAMMKYIHEEIQRKKTSSIQMKENHAMSKKKVEILKAKRSSYDQALTSLKSSDTIKGVSKCSAEVQKEANKMKSISTEIENEEDLMLQAVKITVEPTIGLSLGNHRLSVRNGKHHLHVLQGKHTAKLSAYSLTFSDEITQPPTDGILTFLDFSFPGQEEPRRVYIKMLGNTARARQYLLMVAGTTGHSYLGLHYDTLVRQGQPGEGLIIAPYDGAYAAPLLQNVTVNDIVRRDITAGLVAGVGKNGDFNNAKFGVYLSGNISGTGSVSSFAVVISGLKVLQEIAKSVQREKIKVVDCGVVLF